MDIRAATAFAGQIDNVSQFCRDQQISRQTFYKYRRRFGQNGLAGLQEQSRRPNSSPGQTPAAVEEAVLHQRKQLLEQGLDHGPQSIVWALQRQNRPVPSRSTVWRILTRHGLITAQPHKRPKSATTRFCFARPNQCWQSDWTCWHLADDTAVAIAGTLDDHSRYLTALQACGGQGTAELVWSVMLAGITECGVPAMSLSDNGIVYTGRLHAFESAFEANLRALGTHTINSTPSHPQTCGKIERFWQTLKKWLRPHPVPATIDELNTLLDEFRDYYNHHRPHRALSGATPAAAFHGTDKARPADTPYRHRYSSAATPSAKPRANCTSRPTASTWACAGPDTNATSSAKTTTSPSTAEPPWCVNSPSTPPATTNPATRTREPTAPVNPNRHHGCQRCPET